MHGKYWDLNSPKFGEASEDTILEYITKHITCSLPDPETSPVLYDLVIKYQMHRCGPSCERMVGRKGKKSKICRYGFPKPVQDKPSLNSLDKMIKSRQKGRVPIKLYNLGNFIDKFLTNCKIFKLTLINNFSENQGGTIH